MYACVKINKIIELKETPLWLHLKMIFKENYTSFT